MMPRAGIRFQYLDQLILETRASGRPVIIDYLPEALRRRMVYDVAFLKKFTYQLFSKHQTHLKLISKVSGLERLWYESVSE